MNENILQAGFDLTPFQVRGAKGGDGPGERGRVAAADVEDGAEGGGLGDTGALAELGGQAGQIRPGDGPGGQAGLGDDLGGGAVASSLPPAMKARRWQRSASSM